MKKVFFYRNFHQFSGGHLKVHDYFNHVALSNEYIPFIYLDKSSLNDESNPWSNQPRSHLESWNPFEADVLFLAGNDWQYLPEDQRSRWPKPVVNLIQGIRHSIPDTQLWGFLRNRAIRIGVSPEVSQAIIDTGMVNGPVFTIPNGIDRSLFTSRKRPHCDRLIDLMIAGQKHRELAHAIEGHFQGSGLRINCVTRLMPRAQFIEQMGNSRITVFLPLEAEGFYLPALEGMASATLVICPDCIGNRSFCHNRLNCLTPPYTLGGITDAVTIALSLNESSRNNILTEAESTVWQHDLETEREAFLEILNQSNSLWE